MIYMIERKDIVFQWDGNASKKGAAEECIWSNSFNGRQFHIGQLLTTTKCPQSNRPHGWYFDVSQRVAAAEGISTNCFQLVTKVHVRQSFTFIERHKSNFHDAWQFYSSERTSTECPSFNFLYAIVHLYRHQFPTILECRLGNDFDGSIDDDMSDIPHQRALLALPCKQKYP
jgi:hypothetical protein